MKKTILILSILLFSQIAKAEDIRVIDGDTLEVGENKIRLAGIDAPELDQQCFDKTAIAADITMWNCGVAAKEYLTALVNEGDIGCGLDEYDHPKDRYGRFIATCWIGDMDVNQEMVRAGYAVAYREYSEEYISEEEEAKAAKRRIWAYYFIMPWEHRENKKNN